MTVHASHSYKWQTENGQYWGECEFCGDKVEKTNVPSLTITSPDAVCRTQDFKFSFNLPEGCTNPVYSYEFKYTGRSGRRWPAPCRSPCRRSAHGW